MLSCRKASLLMEKRLHARLGVGERFQLFMHKQMCDGCRLYEQQNLFINGLLQKKRTPKDKVAQMKLPQEVKYRIVKELEKL